MITRNGSRIAAAVAALVLGGAGVIAAQAPASASDFSAAYTCAVPGGGSQTSKIEGSLTASPNPAKSGSQVSFALNINSISVSAPADIESWDAKAAIAGSGAETSAFDTTASGGSIPAGQPIPDVRMTGSWTPSAAGTDTFVIGDITINLKTAEFGNVTVSCAPSGAQPNAETLTVG